VSDIDTAMVDSLKVLDPNRPIREAEVMRDLYRPAVGSGQSYSERQLYAAALDRLSGEVALVKHITKEEAVLELESLVIARGG
jgi:RNA polymerase-interacting CarD/CdnL/TRCF family regulator